MDKTVPLFNRATNRSVSPTNRSSAPNEDFVSKALLAYKLRKERMHAPKINQTFSYGIPSQKPDFMPDIINHAH